MKTSKMVPIRPLPPPKIKQTSKSRSPSGLQELYNLMGTFRVDLFFFAISYF